MIPKKNTWQGSITFVMELTKDWFWGFEIYVEVKFIHLWI